MEFIIKEDGFYKFNELDKIIKERDELVETILSDAINSIDSIALEPLKEDILLAAIVREFLKSYETKKIPKNTQVTIEIKNYGLDYVVIANLRGKIVYNQA